MRFPLPLALLAVTTTAACVDDAAPKADVVARDLELEHGGFDTADEAPMFDEPSAYAPAEIEADRPAIDEMSADPVLASMETSSTAAAHDLLVLWGRFPHDPTATTWRDWGGELRISRGGLRVHRAIAFEDATDRVLPRTDRASVQFDSRTRPAVDGLALRVVDPAPGTGPLHLSYAGRDGTAYDLDLSQLANGPLITDAGGGNRMIVEGVPADAGCAHGFLRGRWRVLSPEASAFRAVASNASGEVIGHVRGIAGHRHNGDAVMFGKLIDRDGHFVGLLEGTYDNGHFTTRWLDKGGDHGRAGGIYVAGPADRAGALLGRWAETSCAN